MGVIQKDRGSIDNHQPFQLRCADSAEGQVTMDISIDKQTHSLIERRACVDKMI